MLIVFTYGNYEFAPEEGTAQRWFANLLPEGAVRERINGTAQPQSVANRATGVAAARTRAFTLYCTGSPRAFPGQGRSHANPAAVEGRADTPQRVYKYPSNSGTLNMQLRNSTTHFGAISQLFHWSVAALFVFEYVVANLMLRIKAGETLLGITQGWLYNWHKSIGLILLLLALARIVWRKAAALPDWAPTLTPAERRTTAWLEKALYGCMILMPLSGYLFVMAGGFGVKLFGVYNLPNPIGEVAWLATASRLLHVLTSYGIVLALGAHLGLVLRHQLVLRDGLLRRMLPFGRP